MKRTFLLVFGIILSFSGFAYDFEKDRVYYKILSFDDMTVEVTIGNWYNSYSGSHNIPETVEYMGKKFAVVAIGDEAFMCVNNYSPSGVITLPPSIRRIGNKAFLSYGIRSINLPNGLKTIGNQAFWDTKISSITLPASVDSIGYAAFTAIDELTEIKVHSENPNYDSREDSNSIIDSRTNTLIATCSNSTIPNTIKHIGKYAFGFRKFNMICLPEGLESIDSQAFIWCNYLESIKIPSSVTNLGDELFLYCQNLRAIELPESLSRIPKQMFGYCEKIEKIELPQKIKIIDSQAFIGCTLLKEINIPSLTESIGESAFSGCKSLYSITIPKNVKSIGNNAFDECGSLATITVLQKTPIAISENCFPDLCYKLSTLFVPIGSKDAYSKKNFWKKFSDIQEFDPTNIGNIYHINSNEVSEFGINGIKKSGSKLKIIRKNDGTVIKYLKTH